MKRPKESTVVMVQCPRCKAEQEVHVARGGGQKSDEMVRCLDCNNSFKVALPNRIVAGPFPT